VLNFTPRPGENVEQLSEYLAERRELPVDWASAKKTTGFANETIKVSRQFIEPGRRVKLKNPSLPENPSVPQQELPTSLQSIEPQ
jgi:hypothetical protein